MYRVMVVDDEAAITTQLEERLTLMGYEVVDSASSGQEAIEMARRIRPDIVLMDIVMPGSLDGIDASVIIKAELDIPVIFLTAYASEKFVNRAKDVEPFGYIVKPFQERELKAAIEIAIYKKNIERRLHASEEKYRSLVESTEDSIYLLDRNCKYLFMNKEYLSRLGLEAEKAKGTTYADFHSEDDTKDFAGKVKEVFETGNSIQHGLELPEGSRYFLRTLSPVKNPEERTVSVTVVSKDITGLKKVEEALRESEEKYRSLVESTEDSIYLLDRNCTYLFMNKKHLSRLSLTAKKAIGRTYAEFHSEDDTRELVGEVEKVFKTGKSVSYEYGSQRGDGYFIRTLSPVKDPDGRTVSITVVSKDITERKRTEEETKERVKELECLHGIAEIVERPGISLAEVYKEVVNLLPGGWQYPGIACARITTIGDSDFRTANYRETEWRQSSDFEAYGGKAGEVEVYYLEERPQGHDGPFIKEERLLIDAVAERLGDITERKNAENKLQQSEERYRSVFENTGTATVIIEEDTTISTANTGFEELSGYSKEEIEGKKSWTEFVVKEDLDRIKEYHDKRRKNGESAPTEYEFQFIDKQGNIKDIFLKVGMIPGTKRSVASLIDVTFLKQAHEEIAKRQKYMESVVNSAPDAIVTLDASYNITEWNPGAERIFGYSRDEVVGKDIDDLIGQPDMKHKLKALTKKVLSGEMVLSHETIRYRKDGTPVNVIAAGSPILIDGELHGVVVVYTDITERNKLQTQLLQAQKMETVGILAGGVAHDLNNILSGIVSYPELLLLNLPEDSTLRKPLLTIKTSGEKAAVVVQDLLTMARRGVTTEEIVNLNSIISEQLESPEYEKLKSFHPNVDIKTNLEKDLLNINGSTAHLSKTVFNLISNAAEAMPDGGKVLVSTENLYIDRPIKGYDHVEEGDYVTVTVSDTGIGISKKDMNRIFEPFYTKKVMGRSGSGLGMSVVWGTVKDHNGYIDVKSTKGKGTAFTLYFPVIREELATDKSLLSIEDYMGKGESILIVDDVEEQREIASVMLKKLGYSVKSVSSGEEAIEYMKDNSVDLLVLDMIMDPGIDGLDTYKKILELHPKQKAIIASGFSETDRVKEAKKLGAGAYVKKPYVLEKIGVVIKEELEK